MACQKKKKMPGISINHAFGEKIRFGANTFHVPYSGAIVKSLFVTLERWKSLKVLQKSRCSLISIKVKNNGMIMTSSRTTEAMHPLTATLTGVLFWLTTFTRVLENLFLPRVRIPDGSRRIPAAQFSVPANEIGKRPTAHQKLVKSSPQMIGWEFWRAGNDILL